MVVLIDVPDPNRLGSGGPGGWVLGGDKARGRLLFARRVVRGRRLNPATRRGHGGKGGGGGYSGSVRRFHVRFFQVRIR
jgi:hypothetical protein